MLNWTVPSWPSPKAAREETSSGGTPFDLTQAFEAQTRLWNQLLDTNRSLWALYAPWMQGTPWLWSSAVVPAQPREDSAEPETADGPPDAFEAQARLWNHLLDANRSFWSGFTWPAGVWPSESDNGAQPGEDAAPKPAKPTAGRSGAGARSKPARGR